MVIAGRISDKNQNANLIKSEPKKESRRRRKTARVPDEWDPNNPFQLKYDEMISKLKLPEGYVFWDRNFCGLIIPGNPMLIHRVQRIARKKADGGYKTHAIMLQEGIPYQPNTIDYGYSQRNC